MKYFNKTFIFLDDEGEFMIVFGIPRVGLVRNILAMQMKKYA